MTALFCFFFFLKSLLSSRPEPSVCLPARLLLQSQRAFCAQGSPYRQPVTHSHGSSPLVEPGQHFMIPGIPQGPGTLFLCPALSGSGGGLGALKGAGTCLSHPCPLPPAWGRLACGQFESSDQPPRLTPSPATPLLCWPLGVSGPQPGVEDGSRAGGLLSRRSLLIPVSSAL